MYDKYIVMLEDIDRYEREIREMLDEKKANDEYTVELKRSMYDMVRQVEECNDVKERFVIQVEKLERKVYDRDVEIDRLNGVVYAMSNERNSGGRVVQDVSTSVDIGGPIRRSVVEQESSSKKYPILTKFKSSEGMYTQKTTSVGTQTTPDALYY